jgi:hypothetical protein
MVRLDQAIWAITGGIVLVAVATHTNLIQDIIASLKQKTAGWRRGGGWNYGYGPLMYDGYAQQPRCLVGDPNCPGGGRPYPQLYPQPQPHQQQQQPRPHTAAQQQQQIPGGGPPFMPAGPGGPYYESYADYKRNVSSPQPPRNVKTPKNPRAGGHLQTEGEMEILLVVLVLKHLIKRHKDQQIKDHHQQMTRLRHQRQPYGRLA